MLSFHVKFVQTDGRTTVQQYASDLSIRGHKKLHLNCQQYNVLYKILTKNEKKKTDMKPT